MRVSRESWEGDDEERVQTRVWDGDYEDRTGRGKMRCSREGGRGMMIEGREGEDEGL